MMTMHLAACGGGNQDAAVLAESTTEVQETGSTTLYDHRLVLKGPDVTVAADTPALLCVSGQWSQWREAGAAVAVLVDQVPQPPAKPGDAGEVVVEIEHCTRIMLPAGRSSQSVAVHVGSLDAAGKPVAGLRGYKAELQWRIVEAP